MEENNVIYKNRTLKGGMHVKVKTVDAEGKETIEDGIIRGRVMSEENQYIVSFMRRFPFFVNQEKGKLDTRKVCDMDYEEMKKLHKEGEIFPYEEIIVHKKPEKKPANTTLKNILDLKK